MNSIWCICVLASCAFIGYTAGHGRMVDPPSRASMWRYGYPNPPNYDDNQMFCGGIAIQYDLNGGKCGVCGDAWNEPREHEAGGKYANGIITRHYAVGQVISVLVQITANHLGWMEFRLCPTNDVSKAATHECFDKHLLEEAVNNGTRIPVAKEMVGFIQVHLRLPPNLSCSRCVLQWKYNAGNSWGFDVAQGEGCLGCGNQEQFYACSDISIGDNALGTTRLVIPPSTNAQYTTTPKTSAYYSTVPTSILTPLKRTKNTLKSNVHTGLSLDPTAEDEIDSETSPQLGNSWGTNARSMMECFGCGNQEQFYACSDIAIVQQTMATSLSSSPLVSSTVNKSAVEIDDIGSKSQEPNNMSYDHSSSTFRNDKQQDAEMQVKEQVDDNESVHLFNNYGQKQDSMSLMEKVVLKKPKESLTQSSETKSDASGVRTSNNVGGLVSESHFKGLMQMHIANSMHKNAIVKMQHKNFSSNGVVVQITMEPSRIQETTTTEKTQEVTKETSSPEPVLTTASTIKNEANKSMLYVLYGFTLNSLIQTTLPPDISSSPLGQKQDAYGSRENNQTEFKSSSAVPRAKKRFKFVPQGLNPGYKAYASLVKDLISKGELKLSKSCKRFFIAMKRSIMSQIPKLYAVCSEQNTSYLYFDKSTLVTQKI